MPNPDPNLDALQSQRKYWEHYCASTGDPSDPELQLAEAYLQQGESLLPTVPPNVVNAYKFLYQANQAIEKDMIAYWDGVLNANREAMQHAAARAQTRRVDGLQYGFAMADFLGGEQMPPAARAKKAAVLRALPALYEEAYRTYKKSPDPALLPKLELWNPLIPNRAEIEAEASSTFPSFSGDRKSRYTSPESYWATEHPEFDALATGALNRAECEQVVEAFFRELKAVMVPTFNAEGPEWLRTVAGNFDGMGCSIGIIQWNFGKGTLQPLIRDAASRMGAKFHRIFRDGRAESLLAHMDSLAWITANVIDSNGVHMKRTWGVDFDMLCAAREFQEIQLEYLNKPGSYWQTAQQRARNWGFTTRKGLAAVFNAGVQSGWFMSNPAYESTERAIGVWEAGTGLKASDSATWEEFVYTRCRQAIAPWPDEKKLQLIRDVFAAQADPRWHDNVKSRFDKILADTTIPYDPWN